MAPRAWHLWNCDLWFSQHRTQQKESTQKHIGIASIFVTEKKCQGENAILESGYAPQYQTTVEFSFLIEYFDPKVRPFTILR